DRVEDTEILVERFSPRQADAFVGTRPLDELMCGILPAPAPRELLVEVGVTMLTDLLADAAPNEPDEGHRSACVDTFPLNGLEAFSDTVCHAVSPTIFTA